MAAPPPTGIKVTRCVPHQHRQPNEMQSGSMPPLSQPAMGTIGYHIRPGGHDVTPYDWERYMDFADKHF